MKIMLLVILLTLTACATNKQSIVYTSSWKNKWQEAIMNKCKKESIVLTLSIYDSKQALGYSMSKEQFDRVGRMLLWSCYNHFGIII